MQSEEFTKSINTGNPPENINKYALALWHDAKGNWSNAHTLVQDEDTAAAAWIHAYLHRKEGDAGNAAYWYRRAGKKMPDYPLEKEWEELVKVFLNEEA